MTRPSETSGAVPLAALAAELVAELPGHRAGRAARTVLARPGMRATVMALAAGGGLAEHEAPRAASLQVLVGRVRLVSGGTELALQAGDLAAIPAAKHALEADTDAAVLLTVALADEGGRGHH
jgi:quercetin dioxygenase-like cupin family protein